MLSSNIRLFTWVDAEAVIQAEIEKQAFPDWIVCIRAYWDGLFIGVRPGRCTVAIDWLAGLFEPRFDREKQALILESLPEKKRVLAVHCEETDEAPPEPRFRPSLQRPAVLCGSAVEASPPEMGPDLPPVVAFHSFKGGVGRTLSAISLARAITERDEAARVLFVDADLEAPGVTWSVHKRFPNPSVSFADFLALVHSDPDGEFGDSIDLVGERLKDLSMARIHILPAFRTAAQFTTLEIKPEHLVQGAQNPFVLTDAVAQLGAVLGVDTVILDLRAGLSELSAGFFLDPRVFRVLVTTLSSQSIEGTCREIELLSKRAPSVKENEPIPALIFSQVSPDSYANGLVAKHEERLLNAARPFLEAGEEGELLDMPRIVTPFSSTLQVLPNDWTEVMKRITQAGMIDEFNSLVEWLPLDSHKVEERTLETGTVTERRRNLADFSKRLIYAETGALNEFLSIPPLKHLASDFFTKIPIAVVVGAKGSGKTYTFLQIAFRETWAEFVKAVGNLGEAEAALICPVLKSKNIESEASRHVVEARRNVASRLNLGPPPDLAQISDFIRDRLDEDLHEGKWRDLWIDILVWSAGFKVFETGAGKQFPTYLAERQYRVLPVIDGLEDLFQEIAVRERQQTALRALIQDVPEWLEQQPDQNIGLAVFVRQDMVLNAVKQNAAQLMARYAPYALRWNAEEALRLAAWVGVQSGALPEIEAQSLERHDKKQLSKDLFELWGRKLGGEKSKEARSAEWVIAALSDLNGQIQARDLVRFLHQASLDSERDTYWKDRILVPTAIRGAIKVCSKEKIGEISIENNRLEAIFNKLKALDAAARMIPFDREQVQLTIDEMLTLENNGVVYKETDDYYMPEIFRDGLNFKLKAGARPRVLALSRKVRK